MTSASPRCRGRRRTIKGGFWGMEKKTIRSGAPFVFAGAGVMAVALTMGIGSLVSYPVAQTTSAKRNVMSSRPLGALAAVSTPPGTKVTVPR